MQIEIWLMRKIVLQLAVSLDGTIEPSNVEYEWCFTDQDYGMKEFFKRIDSVFMGRKSYELTLGIGEEAMPEFPKLKEYVFSTTMTDAKPGVVLIKDNVEEEVKRIKAEPGKDIWLFGGASLTSYLLNYGLVDEMSLAVHPIILGSGKPLFSNIDSRVPLNLVNTQSYSSGLVMLTYNLS